MDVTTLTISDSVPSVQDLSAVWVDSQGITLNWNAPDLTDAELSGLVYYGVSFLDCSYTVPRWAPVAILRNSATGTAATVSSPFSTPVFSANAATTYAISWQQMTTWSMAGRIPQHQWPQGSGNNTPLCVAVSVQTINIGLVSSDVSSPAPPYSAASEQATLFVFPPSRPGGTQGATHFKNDFTFDGYGQVQTWTQDTDDEIKDSVAMLLGTQQGQRGMAPDYGIEDPTFTYIDTDAIAGQLSVWEDRADATLTVVYDQKNTATLQVNLRSTPSEA